MNIYPNPNNGQFTIALSEGESREVFIYDMMGKEIYREQLNNSTEVEFSHRPKGIYYIKGVAENGKTDVTKMIVSK